MPKDTAVKRLVLAGLYEIEDGKSRMYLFRTFEASLRKKGRDSQTIEVFPMKKHREWDKYFLEFSD
jgi:hypothetical protein